MQESVNSEREVTSCCNFDVLLHFHTNIVDSFSMSLETDGIVQIEHDYTRDIDSHWRPHLLSFGCPMIGRE